MTEKVTIERRDNLPMPLIFLQTAEDLAAWQVDQLLWALNQGHRALTASCFDTAPLGFDIAAASMTVLKSLVDFVYDHPEIESLTILCGDDTSFRAYSFHFNMWYAAHKPHHEH